ncbi:peptidase domain-containing ABC transporter [Planctomycetaceae bacterium SH139]
MNNNGAEQAIALVQKLADHHGVRVDSSEVSRWLPVTPPRTQDELLAWLVSSGSRLGIRVGYADCRFADVLAFAKQGIPVALRIVNDRRGPSNPTADWESVDGYSWVLVRGYSWWSGFRVDDVGGDRLSRTIGRRNFKRMVGLDLHPRVRGLIAQPLSAEVIPASGSHATGKPLTRLMRLLQPDSRDIWAMVVFALIVGVLTLAAPLAVEALVNTVAFGRYVQPVLILSLMLFIFLGFAAILQLLLAIIAEMLQRRLFVRISEDLGYRLPRVSAASYDGKYAPELVNRFLDVANIQKATASLLLDAVSLVVAALVGMAVLGFYHTFLLGFDIVMLSLMAFTIFVLGRGAIDTANQESKKKYYLTSWLQDLVRCPTAFALHGGQRFALERTDKMVIDYLDLRRQHFRILVRQISFSLLMYAVCLTVLLGLGGWLVIIGEITLGQLVAAELIVGVVVGAFAKMGKHMESFYDLMASVDKVGVLLDLPTEVVGGPLQIDGAEAARVRLRELNVDAGGKRVVKNFSGDATQAGLTVIAGPPASGKSTLIEVLSVRRVAAGGDIVIDGNSLSQLDSETLRYQIGLARDIEVFSGTLSENVHIFRPNIRLSDVRDALEVVGLTTEIRNLPDGLDTPLSTTGSPLSRDQTLRLMIARAIVGRPRLLLVDGTLDGLADGSLEKVLAGLTQRPQPWTLVVASGRQAVRARADVVWWLGKEEVAPTVGGQGNQSAE